MNTTLVLDSLTAERKSSRRAVQLIAGLRALFFLLATIGINSLIPLGTSPYIIGIAAGLGVLCATWLASSRLTDLSFCLILGFVYLLFTLATWLSSYIPADSAASMLRPSILMAHLELCVIAFIIAALSTWAFWRMKETLTIELLVLLGVAVLILSGHRNFHFDSPRVLNTFAWSLGVDQLLMLVIVGVGVTVCSVAYASAASLPGRPDWGTQRLRVFSYRGRSSVSRLLLFGALFLSVILGLAQFTYRFYNHIAQQRIANGVGQESQEGMTPLGFQSALGSTNQPAALVRLEGDYNENPFTPMLYLRESALSSFNGKEMVIADHRLDRDVSWSDPRESYVGVEDSTLQSRVPVVQSFFLLSDHKNAFALDYPLSLTPLKNPNPGKFKATYRAYSIAPGFGRSALDQGSVGDPRWDTATRAHYLAQHTDQRYAALAKRVAGELENPLQRAHALSAYLSNTAIYTLTPNHQVDPASDQTAPFLFGDMRGYCVHFAHAMVYMLRSLGIPSRIGTGYLTDLSQSKDGHILLRMSDRHAWAEVYVAEAGWIPFDVQPTQVESHADTKVDAKLLEELMGMIEPGEEILPSDLSKDEPSFDEPSSLPVPDLRFLAVAGTLILIIAISIKIYLRYGWAVARSPEKRLRRSYITVVSRLCDLGLRRSTGETRAEFQERMSQFVQGRTLSLTAPLTETLYREARARTLDRGKIDELRRNDLQQLRNVSFLKRILATLSPSSVLAALSGRSW